MIETILCMSHKYAHRSGVPAGAVVAKSPVPRISCCILRHTPNAEPTCSPVHAWRGGPQSCPRSGHASLRPAPRRRSPERSGPRHVSLPCVLAGSLGCAMWPRATIPLPSPPRAPRAASSREPSSEAGRGAALPPVPPLPKGELGTWPGVCGGELCPLTPARAQW
jgi:hypothetical protein